MDIQKAVQTGALASLQTPDFTATLSWSLSGWMVHLLDTSATPTVVVKREFSWGDAHFCPETRVEAATWLTRQIQHHFPKYVPNAH